MTTVQMEHNFETLMQRQDHLEKELARLREMYEDMKERNTATTERIHVRIDRLEEELAELRDVLNELKSSIGSLQIGMTFVQQHVSDINAKQDVSITAQDKFITQLWKAFFTLLGVLTAVGTAVVTFLK